MAQKVINIGASADDGTGESWRSALSKVNDNDTELYSRVGVAESDISSAESAISTLESEVDTLQAETANFTKTYWFDDADSLTDVTPISHTGGATTYLTNNSLGSSTTSYNPEANAKLWNQTTGKFDFTSLKIGDIVEIRGDISVTTTAVNQEIDILFSLAEGTVGPYELNINHACYKVASSGNAVTFMFRIYIGSEATRTGGARFAFESADNATIVVNGWFYSITEV